MRLLRFKSLLCW